MSRCSESDNRDGQDNSEDKGDSDGDSDTERKRE
jgi:hypothetical protein